MYFHFEMIHLSTRETFVRGLTLGIYIAIYCLWAIRENKVKKKTQLQRVISRKETTQNIVNVYRKDTKIPEAWFNMATDRKTYKKLQSHLQKT